MSNILHTEEILMLLLTIDDYDDDDDDDGEDNDDGCDAGDCTGSCSEATHVHTGSQRSV